jgi:MFS family permease
MKNNRKFSLPSVLRALRHRNFRLFFIGQGISLTGTWLQTTAMSWLVYRLTGSAFLLGVVGFSTQLPSIFISPFAGVLSDRWKRRTILLVTQSLSLLQAAILAALVVAKLIVPWHIIVLSLFIGVINSFDVPARQSFMMEMIDDKNDIGNALAINSAMFNSARLIGPTIAGILIAVTGEGVCFVLNAASFIAVLYALYQMRVKERTGIRKNERVLSELKTGFDYVTGSRPIRDILLNLSLVSLMGMPYMTLMPVFAKNVFHGGPHTMGFLMSSAGLGALCGAIYLASRKSVVGLVTHIYVSGAIFGAAMVAFAVSASLPLAMFFLFIAGFGMIIQSASSNTILQSISDEDKRGRVMSFYTIAFIGISTFGSLLYGSLAGVIGVSLTVIIGGVFVMAGAFVFSTKIKGLRKLIRPIYIRNGIIREIETGIEAAVDPEEIPGNGLLK